VYVCTQTPKQEDVALPSVACAVAARVQHPQPAAPCLWH